MHPPAGRKVTDIFRANLIIPLGLVTVLTALGVCYDFFIASRAAEGGWDFARPFVAGVARRDEWPAPLLVVAFVIGVFPRMLWQIIAAFFTKVTFLKLVLPSIEAKQPLSDLDGLTVWHESRLEEEDVENVPNMASVDVVDIMLHTQIPAERLIAWIDQAILGSALGPAQGEAQSPLRGKLRTLGIRTATQLLAVYQDKAGGRKELENLATPGSVAGLVTALRTEVNFEAVASWRGII